MDGPFYEPDAELPPKINAAMQYLRWASTIPDPTTEYGSAKSYRDLAQKEQVVYDAALLKMLEYFNAPGFGDEPPGRRRRNGPDDPKRPKPVPK